MLQIISQMKFNKGASSQFYKQKLNNNTLTNFPSISLSLNSNTLIPLSKLEGQIKHRQMKKISLNKQLTTCKTQNQVSKLDLITQGTSHHIKQTHRSTTKITKTLYLVEKFQKKRALPLTSLAKLETKINDQRYEESKRQQNLSKLRQLKNREQFNTAISGHIKYSQKKFGFVQGYAACSNMGTLNHFNHSRISISHSKIKSYNHQVQVGFFAIFQGKNGSNKAQYWRQYFYGILINDQLLVHNTQKSISRAFQKLQKNFNYDPRFDGDFSIVNTVLCLILNNKMFIVRSGYPNATISMNLGLYMKSMAANQKQVIIRQKKSLSSMSIYNNKLLMPKQQILIRIFQLNQQYDFLILGSEGIYQPNKQKNQLGRSVWKYLIAIPNQQTLESQTLNMKVLGTPMNKLAQVCSKITEEFIRSDSLGRSMSIILISFANLNSCFQQPCLSLPTIFGLKNSNENNHIEFDEQVKSIKQKQEQHMEQQLSILQKQLDDEVVYQNTKLLHVNNKIHSKFIKSLNSIQ